MRLEGKVAVVPGGTSGIGKAIALGFAREGATVVVASRSEARVKETAEELEALGNAGFGVVADITDEAQVRALMDEVKARFGKIDVMLNSAGFYPSTPFLAMSTAEWRQVISVNMDGPFLCARAVAPIMQDQHYGRIIFIASGQALRGVPLMAHYSAAKGGVVAFSRAIASELAPCGITVNTIAAGLTTTDTVMANIPQQFLDFVATTIPVKRLGTAEDYVGAAVFLASDESAYITAETLTVDGGNTWAMAAM